MKYFLDSAKLYEIDEAFYSFGIDGVTTNPNHVMNSGKSHKEVIEELSTWAKTNAGDPSNFPISIEINPHLVKEEEMLKEAEDIAKISEYFVIKLPCTLDGIMASRKLEQKGIRTNVTLVFSPSQALAVARVNASFVSPFVGWKENSGEDCVEYLTRIHTIYNNFDNLTNTKIITAAIRNGKQIAEAATIGLDIVTCGIDVYKASFAHPFTDFGLHKFQNAWDNTKK